MTLHSCGALAGSPLDCLAQRSEPSEGGRHVHMCICTSVCCRECLQPDPFPGGRGSSQPAPVFRPASTCFPARQPADSPPPCGGGGLKKFPGALADRQWGAHSFAHNFTTLAHRNKVLIHILTQKSSDNNSKLPSTVCARYSGGTFIQQGCGEATDQPGWG